MKGTVASVELRAGRETEPGGGRGSARPDPFQILVAEHELLRRQMNDALEGLRVERGRTLSRATAESILASLRLHLEREDRALYPMCELIFDGREGAAAVMRSDHAAILKDLNGFLARRDRKGAQAALVELLRRLEDHFLKEERILFPLMAARVSNAEAANLVRGLRAVNLASSASGRGS